MAPRLLPVHDWGIEPVADEDRVLTVQDFTALWAFFLIGLPVLLAGAELMAPPAQGGLGFSVGQLVLATLIGALVGSFFMALAGWVGAYNGVPTAVLIRPSLGVAGGYLLVILNLVFLVGWAALELGVAGRAVNLGLIDLTGSHIGMWGVLVPAVPAALMLVSGPRLVAVWWVRRFAVWPALALFLFLLWRLVSEIDLAALLAEPRAPGFWAGVDLVAALAILFFPLVADTARLVSDESSAASGAGVGFGVSAILLLLVGGALVKGPGMGGVGPADVLGAVVGTGATVAWVVLLLWVLLAEADQAFAFLYSAGVTSQTVLERLPAWVPGVLLLVVAGLLGISLEDTVLLGFLELLLAVYVPLFGIFLADFFVVRGRRYNLDAMYRREGPYRGINTIALLPLLIGFVLYQWIDPSGPLAWEELVRSALPGGRGLGAHLPGLPPAFLSLLVSFGLYAVVGRWRVEEEVYVHSIKGRL